MGAYVVGNLEGVFGDGLPTIHKTGKSRLAPSRLVNGLQSLGLEAVTLANNHMIDFGSADVE
ncbi:hypothetical protein CKO35_16100 [Ectothiorhodospira shaposhnikovii]|nr:hypothetical protein [Ectothiorhodospira shaposhnikovii]